MRARCLAGPLGFRRLGARFGGEPPRDLGARRPCRLLDHVILVSAAVRVMIADISRTLVAVQANIDHADTTGDLR